MTNKTVTIEADDLETLLYAAGAMKPVEMALIGAQEDIQFQMAKPKLRAAHDRASNAWAAAIAEKVEDVDPAMLGPLERAFLSHHARIGRGVAWPPEMLPPASTTAILKDKRLIEEGVVLKGFRWSDGYDVSQDFTRRGFRLTATGKRCAELLLAADPGA